MLCYATKFVVVCHHGNRKLIQYFLNTYEKLNKHSLSLLTKPAVFNPCLLCTSFSLSRKKDVLDWSLQLEPLILLSPHFPPPSVSSFLSCLSADYLDIRTGRLILGNPAFPFSYHARITLKKQRIPKYLQIY